MCSFRNFSTAFCIITFTVRLIINFKQAILIITLIILLSTEGWASKKKAAAVKRCEKGVSVIKGKTSKFNIRLPLRAPKCFWGVFGEGGCRVSVSCKIDMPKPDGECSNNLVKMSDGSIGSKTFCGKTEFTDLQPSKNLRHLFLVVETDETATKKYDGLRCTAKCAADDEGPNLPDEVSRKFDLRCVCGLQNKDDRIVGGEDAEANEFPWQAAIVAPGTRAPNCGASVINDRFILTAAHCFYFDAKRPDQIEVLVHANSLDMTKKRGAKDVDLGKDVSTRSSGYNDVNKTDEDEKTQRFTVTEIINHPLFDETYDYDYALLRLEKKIKFSEADSPTPICLPAATTFDKELENWVGKFLTVTGWGLAAENAGGTTRRLQKLEVPYINFTECIKSNPDLVTDRMICAGFREGEKDACTGDSGGPLSRKTESNQFRQVGIVSWGEGCARSGKPGMYSRVTQMMQWVHLHTTEQDAKWCQETK